MELIEKFEKRDQDNVVSIGQASEAYYVAGWVRIHADNHTQHMTCGGGDTRKFHETKISLDKPKRESVGTWGTT